MTTKEKLAQTVEYLTDEQATFINEFIRIFGNGYTTKSALMKLAEDEGIPLNFDTALPHDYVKTIQEIHPNFNTGFHVYDYTGKSFGQMKNAAEELILKAQRVFK